MDMTEEYEAARAELDRLIDSPDKTVSVDEYREQLKAAKRRAQAAYRAMMAGF